MANTLLTPDIIAREALMVLENNLVAANLVHRDYEQEFAGAKVGDTITIRKPPAFTVNEFTSTISPQDITESSVALTMNKHFDISVNLTAKELTLDLDRFSEKIIAPAMLSLAERIDRLVYEQYTSIYQAVGTAGSPPDSLAKFAAVDERLNDYKIPLAGRSMILNPKGKATALGVADLVRADARGDEGTAMREASLGRIMGMNSFMAQAVQRHTAGTVNKTGSTINGAVAAGAASMVLAGAGNAKTVKKGDVFTVAGVLDEQGHSVSFVVTAAVTSDGAGAVTVAFAPAAPTGGFGNTAAVTFMDTHAANLSGNMKGIALAVVPLELPMGNPIAAHVSNRGLSVRVVQGYNMSTKTDTISFDMLCAAKVIDPSLLVRVLG